jgi:hypothetical protein
VELILNDMRENVSTPTAKIGDDDSFRLENVQAGRYHVSVAGMNGVYVKSMRLAQMEIDGSVLDLTHGVTAGDGSGGPELSLSISSATGSVSGTVRNDNGATEGASVALFDAAMTMLIHSKFLSGQLSPMELMLLMDSIQGNTSWSLSKRAPWIQTGLPTTKILYRKSRSGQARRCRRI